MEQVRVLKGSTEPIDIKEFVSRWDDSVLPGLSVYGNVNGITQDDVMAKEMDVSPVTIEELNSVCGEGTLWNRDEPYDSELLKKIPDNLELTTVKCLSSAAPLSLELLFIRLHRKELKNREKYSYRQFLNRKLKCRVIDDRMNPRVMVKGELQRRLQSDVDVILTVSVHNPIKPSGLSGKQSMTKLEVDQKFYVLGSQKLTDLRDKISCINDLAIAGDLSENPDDTSGYYAKDIYKSGFFYIEGVFYNDMREPDCRDNSRIIINWAADPSRKIGPMRSAKMEDACFSDLKVRLGHAYVYLHQGDCEHILMFNDIRLSNWGEIMNVHLYPKIIFKRRFKRTICRVCQIHTARWITYGSVLAPDNPSYFCETCFKSLHYDQNGKKLGSFRAHRYFDNHAVI